MNYAEISKETISYLHKSYASLKNSPLEPSLRVLIELRASQINGCAYCCELHTDEARKLNISQAKYEFGQVSNILNVGSGVACFLGDESFLSQVIAWGFNADINLYGISSFAKIFIG